MTSTKALSRSIDRRTDNLLRKIGLEHADERTRRDVRGALRSMWTAGVREGCGRAKFDAGR